MRYRVIFGGLFRSFLILSVSSVVTFLPGQKQSIPFRFYLNLKCSFFLFYWEKGESGVTPTSYCVESVPHSSDSAAPPPQDNGHVSNSRPSSIHFYSYRPVRYCGYVRLSLADTIGILRLYHAVLPSYIAYYYLQNSEVRAVRLAICKSGCHQGSEDVRGAFKI